MQILGHLNLQVPPKLPSFIKVGQAFKPVLKSKFKKQISGKFINVSHFQETETWELGKLVSSGQSISTEARNDRLLKQNKYDVLPRKILSTG